MKEELESFGTKRFEQRRQEIIRLISQDGCPICRACNDALERQWFWFFSESYGEGSGVSKYINYYGFCEKHTLEMARRGPPWQKSAIYSWIIDNKLPKLEDTLKALEQQTPIGNNPMATYLGLRGLKRKIEPVNPKGSCLLCDTLEDASKRVLVDMIMVLDDLEVGKLFRKSNGLCMKHFFNALDYIKPEYFTGLLELVAVQIARLKELKKDFDEYFRKGDYRFANEPKGREQTAWIRAVKRFIGEVGDTKSELV